MNIQLERALRKHMSHQVIDLDPIEYEIIADGEYHDYEVNVNGELKKAIYIGFFNPFPTQEESLLCVYGFLDNKERYTFISHPQEPLIAE